MVLTTFSMALSRVEGDCHPSDVDPELALRAPPHGEAGQCPQTAVGFGFC